MISLVATAALSPRPVARAADPKPATSGGVDGLRHDAARRAFQEGTEAAETERWADSERAFGRACGLSHASSALFNQAVALRALGRHLEARVAFDQLLGRTDVEVSTELRTSALRLRAESAVRVARLELTGLALEVHRIRVDGNQVPDTQARPLRLELSEGWHTIEVSRAGRVPFVASEEFGPGQQHMLRVQLVASSAPPPHGRAGDLSRGGSGARRCWRRRRSRPRSSSSPGTAINHCHRAPTRCTRSRETERPGRPLARGLPPARQVAPARP